MRGPDTPSGGRRRASQISMPAQASARAGIPHDGEPRRFSLANWSVSTRLAALCAMASVLGLVFGGLRISDTVDTSDAYAHTVQLAVVGSKITALAQAMEDERDRATGFMALNMLLANAEADNAGPQVLASINADLKQENAEWTSAKAVTNVAATTATTAVRGHRVGRSPRASRAKPRTCSRRSRTSPASPGCGPRSRSPVSSRSRSSTPTRACSPSCSPSTTRSPPAAATSRWGTTCARSARCREAEDQASQQRAILYGALLDSALNDAGPTQATAFNNVGGPTALSNFGGLDAFTTAQDLQFADQQAFQAVATTAQTQAFLSARAARQPAPRS